VITLFVFGTCVPCIRHVASMLRAVITVLFDHHVAGSKSLGTGNGLPTAGPANWTFVEGNRQVCSTLFPRFLLTQ
jgi:hypothetical protein